MRILYPCIRFLLLFVGNLRVTGRENIPETGPYILAVNHMSKADPPLLLLATGPIALRFFAGEKWERHILFGPIMRWAGAIYINRREVDRRSLREALQALKDGSVFGLAPEGTRSRIGGLIKAKDGAAYLAARAGAPIVPVGVVNTDQIGRRFSRLRRTQLETHFGKPITMPDLGRRPKGVELAAYTHYIMVHIAALLPERHWGYYAESPALKALCNGVDPWPHCLAAEGLGDEVRSV
ncbi:MAG: lysophospholipid acyltransferase family protein [Candidatus Promineifilaceae bacterium]|nr:lysophospholipid acyltransferase family protein [Candidatus Promineifilaceae bacterium]